MSERTLVDGAETAPGLAHGAELLPLVAVDSYNIELKEHGHYLGDQANKASFRKKLDDLRKALKKTGHDPFGDKPTEEISKKQLDEALRCGDEACGLLLGAIEDFARDLAHVTSRFLSLKEWKGTEAIAVGGGLRESEVGLRAIARAGVILNADGHNLSFRPIENKPNDAGLIGAVQLAPSWIFKGHDSIFAVDIGGTNIRTGILALNLKKAADCSRVEVIKREIWRHGDEKTNRAEAVEELVAMLKRLLKHAAREKLKPAPFIGIGCPGRIAADGSIERGAQNLPGNWQSPHFRLPREIKQAIPSIAEHETTVILHNDAVLQGLSEVPRMRECEHWGALTIGTGLGNARFTNRKQAPRKD